MNKFGFSSVLVSTIICQVFLFTWAIADPIVDQGPTGGNLLEISSPGIRIEFDESTGTWNAWGIRVDDDRVDERLILSDIAFSCNSFKSSDPGYTHAGEVSLINDVFGQGRELTIRSESSTGLPTLILKLRLHDQHAFLVASGGMANTTGQPIQLKTFTPVIGTLFPEENDFPHLGFLAGNSGGNKTTVLRETPARCLNNVLMTFGEENETRSLLMGGLTYLDFQKNTFINRDLETGQFNGSVQANDAVGKRIDPGCEYLMDDLIYIDFMTDNPFEAAEQYGRAMRDAMDVRINYYTFPSTCMWFISVNHFGGDSNSVNDTPGAVREMDKIVDSGFLKYSPVAVRMVPDCYEADNEQGWWDDEHWQMHGRKERCVVEGGHYKAPYETSAKWCKAITDRGGIPTTYFQPGVRSEDYAEAFPGHMLFNEAHRYRLNAQGESYHELHQIRGGIYKIKYQEAYDYTDPGFLEHMREVYKNLTDSGMKGVFYDYPDRAYSARGGMEDKYSTAATAYRTVYSLARDAFANQQDDRSRTYTPDQKRPMGPVCYLQERLAWGSDLATGLIDSQRTQGDTNVLTQDCVRKAGLRWYKNRMIVNYDMDGKALIAKGPKQSIPIKEEERRAILTMNYTVTGRLLLTETFGKMGPKVLHDLSRTIPYHATTLSARPIDAFISEFPAIYDFPIDKDWHQLVLYNDDLQTGKSLSVRLAGDTAFGAIGLDPQQTYYFYDFWNDRLAGKLSGDEVLRQDLRPGEARMLSVHAVEDHPQWLSTDRHVMQGYVDLVKRPVWNEASQTLTATSQLVENELLRVVLALNGYRGVKVATDNALATIKISPDDPNLTVVELRSKTGGDTTWAVSFDKP